tara:strand:- start:10367 stop:10651 length:285 start_codon:yes stop_codon:yes gene_type:complete
MALPSPIEGVPSGETCRAASREDLLVVSMIFAFDSTLAALAVSFAAFAAAILVTRFGCASGRDAFSWLITLVVVVNDNKVEVLLVEILLRIGKR